MQVISASPKPIEQIVHIKNAVLKAIIQKVLLWAKAVLWLNFFNNAYWGRHTPIPRSFTPGGRSINNKDIAGANHVHVSCFADIYLVNAVCEAKVADKVRRFCIQAWIREKSGMVFVIDAYNPFVWARVYNGVVVSRAALYLDKAWLSPCRIRLFC